MARRPSPVSKKRPAARPARRRSGPKIARGEKGWRLARMLEAFFVLLEASGPLSPTEVNERVAANPRFAESLGHVATTRTDLWTLLRSCGFPLRVVDESGAAVDLASLDARDDRRGVLKRVRWQLDGRRAVEARRLLAAAAAVGRKPKASAVKPAPATGPKKPSTRAAKKAAPSRATSPAAAKAASASPNEALLAQARETLGKRAASSIVEPLLMAMRSRGLVRLEYVKGSSKKRQAEILPRRVWFADGRGFVLGAQAPDGALEVWRLDRVRSVKKLAASRAMPVDEKAVEKLFRAHGGR